MQTRSRVEKIALKNSGFKFKYEPEKVGVIVVDNFPVLGKITALRFLEWVQDNPNGVISLPTGKTPEFFIKEVQSFLNNWDRADIQKELKQNGLDISHRPDLSGLQFVQIDEFYPINPGQHNSFYHYVNKYYVDSLGLDPDKALLIDCTKIGLPFNMSLSDVWPDDCVDITLRYRQTGDEQEKLQKQVLENVDQWCVEYEQKIRELGGIGFFLGGIGPDGHIGFNISGSDLHSTTRLTPTNYETQAAAAIDLGGIEVSKKRLVITIGLATITYNPDCVVIIIAAGEAKAGIVADAIQKPQHIHYPATVLHQLPNARFFITGGAAKLLQARNYEIIQKSPDITDEQVENIVVDLSLERNRPIARLTKEDFEANQLASLLLKKRSENKEQVTKLVEERLIKKIEAGIQIQKNKTFLHTEPHHDDIMLGYLPYIVRHIREHSNYHQFATLTSGFTAVTNHFMLNLLQSLREYLRKGVFDKRFRQGYFLPENVVARNRDVWQYLDGVAANSEYMRMIGQLRRFVRNLVELYDIKNIEDLKTKVANLIQYFKQQYPGKKDSKLIQQLKGRCREWEADCVWGYLGWHSESVHHLRLGFYKGDIFTEEPTVERDVTPILNLLKKIQPDIVSVALDPEASGPDTHYKVLQAMSEALKIYEKVTRRSDLEILGYRNVWYRFHPSEADIFVPVSLNMFALQDSSFKNAFISQRDAPFPSYEYDGPFSDLAQRIQVEQYQMLKTCLGRQFFYEHSSALIRATRGMVFLKSMNLNEFYQRSRDLKKSTENL
ncbi:glucosamine-6-phosphate deaminase [candidate division KSB1 bacterium]|nr:glucosamine-6-phosphate deaminase [candidate division KSB1 bacterium]NIR70091.1 glucosamine-6-phosphate deaminase [candidate division KSB1 bacterium]NIS27516.1 glucosamine-6-phosphate deaminase [candidate division KSB1 bacterium]NIT74367.1 glucosamine-6-phosphate deaminase [candidate division KSB1 bacterium]NIU28234.1 glucosamine-6-phosphate deaminase [candidate division KSB1 bacterium]